jgi:flagellar biogenesis protein FliO
MQLVERLRQTNESMAGREPQGLAAWLLRLLRNGRRLRDVSSRQMRVVETLPLGGKRLLMLVDCGGERFLVGGGTDSVQVIAAVVSRNDEDLRSAVVKLQDAPCQ